MSARTYNEDIAQALLRQEQCDEDGMMCIVSRQAAEEGAGLIRRLTARVEELEAEIQIYVAQVRDLDSECDSASNEIQSLRAENAQIRHHLGKLLRAAIDIMDVHPRWEPLADPNSVQSGRLNTGDD